MKPPPHHEGSPSELFPALQQDLSGLLVPVQDHREVRAEEQREYRAVPQGEKERIFFEKIQK